MLSLNGSGQTEQVPGRLGGPDPSQKELLVHDNNDLVHIDNTVLAPFLKTNISGSPFLVQKPKLRPEEPQTEGHSLLFSQFLK